MCVKRSWWGEEREGYIGRVKQVIWIERGGSGKRG